MRVLGCVAYPRVALPFGRLPGVTIVRPFGTFTIDYQVFADTQNAIICNHELVVKPFKNTFNLAAIV